MERREQKRKRERVGLVFHYAQERCDVSTLNVSRGGALIHTPVSFPSGTLLILECPKVENEKTPVRLLARVVRASHGRTDIHTSYSGLGLQFIRAFSASGHQPLVSFLVDMLGYDLSEVGDAKVSPSGDFVFDFPTSAAGQNPALAPGSKSTELPEYQERREKVMSLQKGRFKVQTPVVYSVHNMHYRGDLFALDSGGLAVSSGGALPFLFSKVAIRYPLDSSPASPRVLLFGETEAVLEPFGREPGFFSAKLQGIDELQNSGVFRMHLRSIAARYPRW